MRDTVLVFALAMALFLSLGDTGDAPPELAGSTVESALQAAEVSIAPPDGLARQ